MKEKEQSIKGGATTLHANFIKEDVIKNMDWQPKTGSREK